MGSISKTTFAKSSIWKMSESLLTRGVSLIISILLARIILPADYGIVEVTSIFISFCTIVVQNGLSTALIRKKEVSDEDFSHAFIVGLVIAVVMYGAFFFIAPFIADFYEEPLITPVIRVQMLSLFLYALGNVRTAIITREFKFKSLCIISFISNLIGGVISVIMANNGFGVWALVYHTLMVDGISAILLFTVVKWKMTWNFSMQKFRETFVFSASVLLTSLLDFCANNILTAIYGKVYSVEDLAYKGKGGMFPELICLHTYGAITSVMLPTMAAEQSENEKLKSITRRMVKMTAYIIFPMMAGLAAVGDKLIPFLLTDVWMPAVPMLTATCIYYAANPFRSINMQLIYAKGEVKRAVRIETFRSIMLVGIGLICIFALKVSIYVAVYINCILAVVVAVLTQIEAKRMIGYEFSEWISDMSIPALMSVAMLAVVRLSGMLSTSLFLSLVLEVAVGVVLYFVLSVAIKPQGFKDITEILRDMIQKRKGAAQ